MIPDEDAIALGLIEKSSEKTGDKADRSPREQPKEAETLKQATRDQQMTSER